jgi:arsenical pump membrane protein
MSAPWPPCCGRRIAHHHDHEVELKEFTLLGLLTVPAALALATLALWASLQLIGP